MRAHFTAIALCTVLVLSGCAGMDNAFLRSKGEHGAGAAAVPERAQRRFEQALASIDANRPVEALEGMESLWADYPYFSGPALNAALLHQRAEQLDLARTWFERALLANANNMEARNAFAVMLRQQGLFNEAKQQYESALAIAPEHAVTHYNIAILYDLYLGDKPAALAHISRYQALASDDSREVQGWIADLQRQAKQSNVTQEGGL